MQLERANRPSASTWIFLHRAFDNLRIESDFSNFYLASHCAFIRLLFVFVCTYVFLLSTVRCMSAGLTISVIS